MLDSDVARGLSLASNIVHERNARRSAAMFFILFFVLVIIPIAGFICLCTLPAIWLALGQTSILRRMPLFLFSMLPLGLAISIARTGTLPVLFWYFVGVGIAAISWTHSSPILRPLIIGAVVVILGAITMASQLDSTWVIRLTFAMTMLAVILSIARVFGYRLVNLTPHLSAMEIERATGRDLDGWIRTLDAVNTQTINHADIRAILRSYGVDDQWQKVIAIAYETALGRRAIGLTVDRRATLIVNDFARVDDLLASPLQQRYSIWQLMVFTFSVACLLGFIRLFGTYRPVRDELIYGVAGVLSLGVIALCSVFGSLSIRNLWQNVTRMAVTAMLISGGILYLASWFKRLAPFNPSLFMPAIMVIVVMMMASLMLVRHGGYRLVRVQAAPRGGPR